MAVLTKRRVLFLLLAFLAGQIAKRRRSAPASAPPRPVSVRPATDIADLVPPAVVEPVVDLVEPEPEPVLEVEPEPEPVLEVEPEPEPEPEPEIEVAPEPEVVEVAAIPEAAVAETPEPEPSDVPVGKYGPGSAAALEGGASPGPEYTVKGKSGSMLFHTPDSPYYGRTIAEHWFSSEEAATAAGFKRWNYKALAAAKEAEDKDGTTA